MIVFVCVLPDTMLTGIPSSSINSFAFLKKTKLEREKANITEKKGKKNFKNLNFV